MLLPSSAEWIVRAAGFFDALAWRGPHGKWRVCVLYYLRKQELDVNYISFVLVD